MADTYRGIEKRQFGRRPCDLRAEAVVSGRAPVACNLLDLSEGGALVDFMGAEAPTRPFRLTLPTADISLLCEVCHVRDGRAGVRFVRLAEGIALMHHVQSQRTATAPATALPLVRASSVGRADVKVLRAALAVAKAEMKSAVGAIGNRWKRAGTIHCVMTAIALRMALAAHENSGAPTKASASLMESRAA